MSVLKVAGLLYQRGNMLSPLLRAWEDLFAEFKLKNELTTFSILGKQRIFIRIGTWSQRHPSVTPKIVWSTRDKYRLPKLRISTITMAFASCIGSCDIPILPCSDEAVAECSSISSDDDNESACDTKIIDVKESDVSAEDILSSSDRLFDANQFPLLNSLGVKKEFQLDALVREIVKYKGSTINFIQNNNRLGFLLLCPSSRTTERCSAELQRKGGAIDSLLTIIRESTKCNEREAAECVIEALFKKQEEAFTSVALAQGLITDDKKMDAIQIEAMQNTPNKGIKKKRSQDPKIISDLRQQSKN